MIKRTTLVAVIFVGTSPLCAPVIGCANRSLLAESEGPLTTQTLPNGQSCQGRLVEGLRHGPWECTYPNKIKAMISHYRHGKREGVIDAWFEDGKPDFQSVWKNGALNGPYRSYHPNGQLHFSSFYVDGILHGVSTEWDDQGRKINETEYRRGEPHGWSRDYHDNGQLRMEQAFVEGKPDGIAQEWRSDGRLKRRAVFRNGKLVTPWQENPAPLAK